MTTKNQGVAIPSYSICPEGFIHSRSWTALKWTAVLLLTTLAGIQAVSASDGGTEADWKPSVSSAQWNYIVIHHSATTSGSVESIHENHRRRRDAMGNPWLGIGYHFVIGNGNGMPDGHIAPTFRWQEQIHGAHSGNAEFNMRGIGICLIGHFEENQPTALQLSSAKRLIKTLSIRYNIGGSQIVGHSAVRATSCPGKLFPMQEMRESAARKNHG
ncbi:MAG: N-acetylmuramoyl-L-alanine amidase [Planctomycetaceae bacterium]|nr:N-acetylmuramoyl-L-alanine amidase [Planctomycetaceae bacterium]